MWHLLRRSNRLRYAESTNSQPRWADNGSDDQSGHGGGGGVRNVVGNSDSSIRGHHPSGGQSSTVHSNGDDWQRPHGDNDLLNGRQPPQNGSNTTQAMPMLASNALPESQAEREQSRFAKQRQHPNPNHQLIAKNFPGEITIDQIRGYFRQFGHLEDVQVSAVAHTASKLCHDRPSGRMGAFYLMLCLDLLRK